ncbi:MAG: DUF4175 domain-containing protein, partial [Oligoflexia bacterium]|nr:DUF4175 domain-containing protein [Oligoflexia bacterium]
FRFTLTTFDPNTNRRVKMTDLDTFNQLHDTEIETLEVAIGLLDSLLQRDAMADVNDAIQNVAQEAQDLSAMAQDAEPAALLARLDQLQRLMAELSKATARLSEGQLREFLNSRLKSAGTLMDEIRKAIAEGRMDDARAMLETLSEQLQQLSQGIEDQVQAGQKQDDQLGEKLKETMDALDKLEQDQDALADKLSQARQSEDGDFQQQVDAWTRMDELAEMAVKQAQDAVDASGDGRGWRVENIRRLERARQVVGGLRDAVRARDIPGARERVENADFARRQARVAVEREAGRSRLGSDAIPDGLRVASEQVHALENTLSELAQLLEQVQQQERRISPELAQQARDLSQQQQTLRQQQQGLQRDVQGIERQLPTSQGQAGKAMERAGQAMDQAGDALDKGQPNPGEGHMRDAADQVAAARDELQHQQQQMQQMQQMQQRMRGKSGGQGQRKDGESQVSRPRMEIPAPEAFRTPEQYRKALLEGMEAQVPEEYQALKKQYYEELVRQ